MIKIKYFVLILLLVFALAENQTALSKEKKNKQQPKTIECFVKEQDEMKQYKLSLIDALEHSLKNNLNIAIKKDQVKQSKLKVEDIKSKKFLYIIKLANVDALEKSAGYTLNAAESSLKSMTDNVLAETASKYFDLSQMIIAKNVANEFLKQGELSLKQNMDLLDNGKATKFEVSQTQVFVENLKQKLLESDIGYMVSSVDLAQYINLKLFNRNIIPEELSDIDASKGISVKALSLIPSDILLNDCLEMALSVRPELDEINFQIKSLEQLKKTVGGDEVRIETIESQISQLKNSLELTRNTIGTTVTQRFLILVGAKNQIDVAKQKYELAQRALDQVNISRNEGKATNKEVLDSQVLLAQSQNDYIKSILNFNTSQINLLKEIGAINIDIIAKNEQIDMAKLLKDIGKERCILKSNTKEDDSSLNQ